MKPRAKDFKDELIRVIEGSSKTSYGKKELALFIEQTYSEFLERHLED